MFKSVIFKFWIFKVLYYGFFNPFILFIYSLSKNQKWWALLVLHWKKYCVCILYFGDTWPIIGIMDCLVCWCNITCLWTCNATFSHWKSLNEFCITEKKRRGKKLFLQLEVDMFQVRIWDTRSLYVVASPAVKTVSKFCLQDYKVACALSLHIQSYHISQFNRKISCGTDMQTLLLQDERPLYLKVILLTSN